MDTLCGLTFHSIVSCVGSGLELNLHAFWNTMTNEVENEGLTFDGEDSSACSLVHRGDAPRLATTSAYDFSALVTSERDHGAVATDDAFREIAVIVNGGTIIEFRHFASTIPNEEVVEVSSIEDGAPDLLGIEESFVLIDAVPVHAT